MSDADNADVFGQALAELGTEYGFESTESAEEMEAPTSDELEIEDTDEVDEVEGDEQEGESEDDEPADAGVVKLSEDMTFELPDGTTVSAKDVLLRQADYTRKTQELAEQRKELEEQMDELGESSAYVEKLATAWEENPVQVISGFFADVDDPTAALAQVIVDLAKADMLDPKFLETFGINAEVREKWSSEGKREREIAELRRKVEGQESERQAREAADREARELEKAVQEFERQWDAVVSKNGLSADDLDIKVAVLEYARDNEIINLEKAYAAYKYEQIQSEKARKPVSEKKRATGAVTKRAATKPSEPKRAPGDIEGAAWEAFNELTAGKGR